MGKPKRPRRRWREEQPTQVLVHISKNKISVFSSNPDGVMVQLVYYPPKDGADPESLKKDCNGHACEVVNPDVFKLAQKYWFS